jgi:hypothetical protein
MVGEELDSDHRWDCQVILSDVSAWLGQAVALISGLGDRETFGWNEVSRIVNEVNAKQAKP